MENNEQKVNEGQNELKKEEKNNTKSEKDNSKKRIKIKFDVLLAIILIVVVLGCIIWKFNKKSNKATDAGKNDIINITDGEVLIKFTPSYKPIIYLYPTEETQVNVQLGNKEKITCSYPKYTTGWNVIAQPNGDLKDIDTNKNLYSLYYESDNVIEFKVEKDGFIVKGEDSAEFLEEKLKILGLTDREAEEFIIYWLPKLESNKYNYIRFATREEIDANMPLTITPEPDTTIRILMEYKGLENPIEVEEENLEKTERKGFVAVEWGGTEIK